MKIKDFTIDKHITSNVLKIGVPMALSNFLMSVANIIYNSFLSGYGDAPIAAMGIATRASMMMAMLYMGLTMGAQPIIGYNFGAKNYDRMKKVIRYVMVVAALIGVSLTILFLVGAEVVVALFIDDSEVIAYGVDMLRAQVSTGTLLGILFTCMSSLQAMGKGIASLILSVARQGLVFIPIAYITNITLGLSGLIWAQPLADLFSVTLSVILLVIALKKLNNPDGEDEILIGAHKAAEQPIFK